MASETKTEGGHAMQATRSFTSSNLGTGIFTAVPSCAWVLAVALSHILRCPLQVHNKTTTSG